MHTGRRQIHFKYEPTIHVDILPGILDRCNNLGSLLGCNHSCQRALTLSNDQNEEFKRIRDRQREIFGSDSPLVQTFDGTLAGGTDALACRLMNTYREAIGMPCIPWDGAPDSMQKTWRRVAKAIPQQQNPSQVQHVGDILDEDTGLLTPPPAQVAPASFSYRRVPAWHKTGYQAASDLQLLMRVADIHYNKTKTSLVDLMGARKSLVEELNRRGVK